MSILLPGTMFGVRRNVTGIIYSTEDLREIQVWM